MALDAELRTYLDAQAALGAKPIQEIPVADARRLAEERAPLQYAVVEDVAAVRDLTVPGPAGPVRTRVYTPAGTGPHPIVVYFHGGGWVTGSLDTHDGLCRSIAKRTPCVVAAVDYRSAPEHPFPAAVDDAWAATTGRRSTRPRSAATPPASPWAETARAATSPRSWRSGRAAVAARRCACSS